MSNLILFLGRDFVYFAHFEPLGTYAKVWAKFKMKMGHVLKIIIRMEISNLWKWIEISAQNFQAFCDKILANVPFIGTTFSLK